MFLGLFVRLIKILNCTPLQLPLPTTRNQYGIIIVWYRRRLTKKKKRNLFFVRMKLLGPFLLVHKMSLIPPIGSLFWFSKFLLLLSCFGNCWELNSFEVKYDWWLCQIGRRRELWPCQPDELRFILQMFSLSPANDSCLANVSYVAVVTTNWRKSCVASQRLVRL